MTRLVSGRLGAVVLALALAVPSTVWTRVAAASPPAADDIVIAQAPISGTSNACSDFNAGDLDSWAIDVLAAAFGLVIGGGDSSQSRRHQH